MDFLRKLLGLTDNWDGRDRRSSLRAKCDFDIEVGCPSFSYIARALDASPKGVRVRVRSSWSARAVKRGMVVNLRYTRPLAEGELDSVQGKITWVKRLSDSLFLLAIGFEDTIDHLRHSWVKPVLLKGLAARVRQQRGYVRVSCDLPVDFVLSGQEHQGRLTDLSVQGARLQAVKAFAQGSHLDLKLTPIGPNEPRLSIRAVVRRAELQQDVIYYGLTFLIDENSRRMLLHYVRALLERQGKTGPSAQ